MFLCLVVAMILVVGVEGDVSQLTCKFGVKEMSNGVITGDQTCTTAVRGRCSKTVYFDTNMIVYSCNECPKKKTGTMSMCTDCGNYDFCSSDLSTHGGGDVQGSLVEDTALVKGSRSHF
uniref:Putative secretory peptide-69 n=1 Tax=Pleurobrachia bachei TaxID=34499 RepID=M4H2J4_PLEBA|nr:putative secretory peptide-69 [Pleurobrachia bachei]|eukprot:sb/3476264/